MNKRKTDNHGTTNRPRKKEPRNPRGTVRGEIQISGSQTGDRRRKSNGSGKGNQRSTRHDTIHGGKTQRPDPKLGTGDNRHTGSDYSLVGHDLRGKISEEQATHMLERMARDQFRDNTNAIFRMGEDVRAFRRYLIHRTEDCYQIFRGATLAAETGSSRVAISWCVADKLNKHTLALEMLWADREVAWRTTEIQHYKHTLDITQDTVKKYIMIDRIADSTARLRYAQEQLNKCLNLAKYWQQKGFNDETARTGIKN